MVPIINHFALYNLLQLDDSRYKCSNLLDYAERTNCTK
jgi:hypothetical protein